MNRKEFRKKVLAAGEGIGLSSTNLKEAADWIAEDRGTSDRHIEKAISLARRFQYTNVPDSNEMEQSSDPVVKYSRKDFVTSDYLIQKINPGVQNLRNELFGASETPFDQDVKSAVSWIIEEAKKPLPKDIQEKVDKGNKIMKRVLDLKMSGRIISSFTLTRDTLDYPGYDGYVHRVPVGENPKLKTFHKAVEKMSKATGFEEYALTIYVLTGLKPLLPRMKVVPMIQWAELPDNQYINRKYVLITLNATDLTYKELKLVYDRYRSSLNIKKKKPISKDQFELFQMVVDKNGPPKKKATHFWNDLLKEWNNIPGKKIYKTWEGVYRVYNRIIKTLDEHYN